jgi:hypothetical protein
LYVDDELMSTNDLAADEDVPSDFLYRVGVKSSPFLALTSLPP